MCQLNGKYKGIPYQALADSLPNYLDWRNFQEAKEICCEMLHRNPYQPQLRVMLANIYMALGHVEKALKQLDTVIHNNPGQSNFLLQKVRMLEIMGRFDDACDLISAIRSKGADHPLFLEVEATAAFQHSDYAKTVELTYGALTDTALPIEERINRLFLCGTAYDKLNEPDKAMEMFQEANRLNGIPFEKEDFTALVDRLIALYSKENLPKIPRSRNTSDRPIFLVSMARSGSSLLHQIIDSHPDASGLGETGYFVYCRGSMVKVHGEGYPENLFNLSQDKLDEYTSKYLDGAGRPRKEGAIRTLDKSIDNFRDLGFIWQTLPNARYIYLQRNPLDCCLSIYQNQFNAPNIHHYTSKLEDIGYVYMQQERLKEHWRNALGIEVLDVNYEVLTAEPEAQIRRILEFMDLPWNEQCLKFYESKPSINTLSLHQVNKPMYRESVGKGERYCKYMGGLKEVLGMTDRQ